MSYNTILLQLEIDRPVRSRVAYAKAAALMFDADLIGFCAAEPRYVMPTGDSDLAIAEAMQRQVDEIEDRLAKVTQEFFQLAGDDKRVSWRGEIGNPNQLLGSVGWSKACAYVAAKHALVGLTKAVAIEYAAKNVRVNAVDPAFVDTPLLKKNLDDETIGQLAALHPLNRLGSAREVAALTCFLLSERASFITGSYHLVDGGYPNRLIEAL